MWSPNPQIKNFTLDLSGVSTPNGDLDSHAIMGLIGRQLLQQWGTPSAYPTIINLDSSFPKEGWLGIKGLDKKGFVDIAIEVASKMSRYDQWRSIDSLRLPFTLWLYTQRAVLQSGGLANAMRSAQDGGSQDSRNFCDVLLAAVMGNLAPPSLSTEFRERAATDLFRSRGIPVRTQSERRTDMAVSAGSTIELFNAVIESVVPKNKTVLVPQGTFEPIGGSVEHSGRKCVLVPTAHTSMQVTAETLQEVIDREGRGEVRALVLVNPSGVFGVHQTREELEKIAKVALRNGVVIISNELYAGLGNVAHATGACDAPFVSIASIEVSDGTRLHHMYDHCVTIDGLSKKLPHVSQKFGFAVSGNQRIMNLLHRRMAQYSLELDKGDLALLSIVWDDFEKVMNLQKIGLEYSAYLIEDCLHQVSRQAGETVFFLTMPFQTGFFTGLSAKRADLNRIGVNSSADLKEYLYRVGGIGTRDLGGMHVGETDDIITVRINVSELDEDSGWEFAKRLAAVTKEIRSENPRTLSAIRAEDRPMQMRSFNGGVVVVFDGMVGLPNGFVDPKTATGE